MKIVNYTPHAIVLNNGTSFEPCGTVARISASFTEPNENGICKQVYGEVEGLPEPDIDFDNEGNVIVNTYLIVSAIVLSAHPRYDVIAPATGHPDTVRNEKGQIVSVPCFVER
jgi:hypothetical protein